MNEEISKVTDWVWIIGDIAYTYRSTRAGESCSTVIVSQCPVAEIDAETRARAQSRREDAENILSKGNWTQNGKVWVWEPA